MNKKILIVALFLILTSHSVLAVNLDFTITPSKKTYYYPNESIPINISVINRDVSWAAKNITLTLLIGHRTYNYDLGKLSPSQAYDELITLPEQPPGTYTIRGILNYTWLFDNIFTNENYNSFEVRFPEIQRLPRDIYVQSFDLPENITSGKTYNVSVNIINNGTIDGDISVELSSLNVSASNQIYLGAGQSTTVPISITFYNSGISIVEAKVYGVVDNIKYLLNYVTKNVYVTEEKIAKIELDKVEIVDRDNFVYQTDDVKIRVYLKNSGNSAAANIKGILSSNENTIKVTKNLADYILIAPKESIYGDEFEINTVITPVGDYNLNLDVNFTDFIGSHLVSFPLTINVKENVIPPCSKDTDCKTDEVCENTKCTKLSCECGEAKEHKCIKYSCCSDYDCEEGYTCSSETHSCEPSKEIKTDVLIITSSKLKTNNAYVDALKKYRKAILEEGLTSFYILVDSPKVQEIFNIQPANSTDWTSVKDVLDKVVYKVKPDYLLILGGVDIIPQPLAKTDEKIPTIPVSDDRYVDTNLDGIPDIAVGRIPNPSGDAIDPIINGLYSSIKLREKSTLTKNIIADTCLFSPPICPGIRDINLLSNSMFEKDCEESNGCHSAPPYCSDQNCGKRNEFYNYLLSSDILNLDAHGSPYSFAAHAHDGKWYDVLDSKELYKKQFNANPLIFTIACHGGTIDCEEGECITREGSVFSFLDNGAAVYIANTRYGIGGLTATYLSEFYNNLKGNVPVGKAMLKMKTNELKKSVSDFENAVIYELQLYGDPTIKLTGV